MAGDYGCQVGYCQRGVQRAIRELEECRQQWSGEGEMNHLYRPVCRGQGEDSPA